MLSLVGEADPNSVNARCLRFLLIVGGTFTVMGLVFIGLTIGGGPMTM